MSSTSNLTDFDRSNELCQDEIEIIECNQDINNDEQTANYDHIIPNIPLKKFVYYADSVELTYITSVINANTIETDSPKPFDLEAWAKVEKFKDASICVDQMLISKISSAEKQKQNVNFTYDEINNKHFYVGEHTIEIGKNGAGLDHPNQLNKAHIFLYEANEITRKGQNFKTTNPYTYEFKKKNAKRTNCKSYYVYCYLNETSQQLVKLQTDRSELTTSLLALISQNHKNSIVLLTLGSIFDFKLTVQVYLNEDRLCIRDLNIEPSKIIAQTFGSKLAHLNFIMKHFFFSKWDQVKLCQDENVEDGYEPKENDDISKENLFDMIYKIHKSRHLNDADKNLDMYVEENCGLRSILRPYQIMAVRWMLQRENHSLFTPNQHDRQMSELHPLYMMIENERGQIVYFHKYLGLYVKSEPLKLKSKQGGILADEMGLGKTLEVLALIIINQREIDQKPLAQIEFHNHIVKTCSFSCICHEMLFSDNKLNNKKQKHNNQDIIECVRCGLLSHQDCVNYNDSPLDYLCMDCLPKMPLIKTKATLVITPAVISHQWEYEIKKHVNRPDFKTLVYKGVNHGFVQPKEMASKYDIVLTTYDVLAGELSHIFAIENKKELRNVRPYLIIPSPITMIDWWRVVLDEAQMVHSTNAKCAIMANSLNAQNYWCVTATPIGRSLDDLHGLFAFIQEDPYYEKKWFRKMLMDPFLNKQKMPMVEALSQVLFRTEKQRVEDQIKIPTQTEKVYWLQFSDFEHHLYERVLELFREKRNASDCEFSPLFVSLDANIRLDELDKQRQMKLLFPLLDLRLTCNHPQLVLNKSIFNAYHQRATSDARLYTMEESLDILIKKTQSECDNMFRSLTMHKNAMAGLCILKNDHQQATQLYRQIIASPEMDFNNNVKLDLLQSIHTFHNLIYVLGLDANIPNDELASLKQTLGELELKYTIAYDEAKEKIEQRVKTKTHEIENMLKNELLVRDLNWWWFNLIDKIKSSPKEVQDTFWSELEFNFSVNVNPQDSFANLTICGKSVKSFQSLKYVILDEMDNLFKCRTTLVEKLANFYGKINAYLVTCASDCHLRNVDRHDNTKSTCELCKFDAAHRHYCQYLFSKFCKKNLKRKRHEDANDNVLNLFCDEIDEQLNNDKDEPEENSFLNLDHGYTSDLEKFFKFFLTLGKKSLMSDNYIDEELEYGRKVIDLYHLLKDESKLLGQYWINVSHQVNALDEIDMAKTRMQLTEKLDMRKQGIRLNNVVEKSKLDDEFHGHVAGVEQFNSQLNLKLRQLVYLQNLKKSNANSNELDESTNDPENKQPCPICYEKFGYSWYVMACGHSYCLACYDVLLNKNNNGSDKIRCSVCRVLNVKKDNILVNNSKSNCDSSQNAQSRQEFSKVTKEFLGITMKGNSSAKIKGVVKCLMKIKRDDKEAKCLVFSEHLTLLNYIIDLLKVNSIEYVFAKDTNSFKKSIDIFKTDPNINVLLMPYSFGANGLNLIEATHVLLVEPTLNRSQEVQAIGRIHRIGQNKPTFVHRFLIRNTIEEVVFGLFSSNTSYSNANTDPIDQTNAKCSTAQNKQTFIKSKKYINISDIIFLFNKL